MAIPMAGAAAEDCRQKWHANWLRDRLAGIARRRGAWPVPAILFNLFFDSRLCELLYQPGAELL
jgi:hypothetical protein